MVQYFWAFSLVARHEMWMGNQFSVDHLFLGLGQTHNATTYTLDYRPNITPRHGKAFGIWTWAAAEQARTPS